MFDLSSPVLYSEIIPTYQQLLTRPANVLIDGNWQAKMTLQPVLSETEQVTLNSLIGDCNDELAAKQLDSKSWGTTATADVPIHVRIEGGSYQVLSP